MAASDEAPDDEHRDQPSGEASAERAIPEATVARLPVYLRSLIEALEAGTSTMASDALAQRTGVNAAQVRKDLSQLGSYGTRGVGYDVEFLVRQISRQLGLTSDRRVAIVGVGNLGRALAHYHGFPERGFRIVAAFDVDPTRIGTTFGEAIVRPVKDLVQVVAENKVAIAIITTPPEAAQKVADDLVAAGVTSILNFAPTVLHVPPHVSLRKVDLAIELQILSYYEQRGRAEPVAEGSDGWRAMPA